MKEKEKILWDLWERLQQIRNCDKHGQIKCYFCGEDFGYVDIKLMVVFKKFGFPFWFVKENNYFCCEGCNTRLNQVHIRKENKRMSDSFSRIPIAYDEADLVEAIQKLTRKIKNHDVI